MPEKCHVHNCTQPAVAKGLCQKHYMQVQRHGGVVNTRPDDWGTREKHPAYRAWCNLHRHYRQFTQSDWLEDFWKFASDVGEKPNKATAFRPDKTKPWSKDNFYWKEHKAASEDRKEYAREWARQARLVNADYYLNADLVRKYGMTIEDYRTILVAQDGVCAVCKRPETTLIRGKAIAMPVDHCHTTGKTRGLLCTQCNRGLGLFGDDPVRLQAAIGYLEKHQPSNSVQAVTE